MIDVSSFIFKLFTFILCYYRRSCLIWSLCAISKVITINGDFYSVSFVNETLKWNEGLGVDIINIDYIKLPSKTVIYLNVIKQEVDFRYDWKKIFIKPQILFTLNDDFRMKGTTKMFISNEKGSKKCHENRYFCSSHRFCKIARFSPISSTWYRDRP